MPGSIRTLALIIGLGSIPALAQSPDPGTVGIAGITYAGTGCPAGTIASNISQDGLALTILYASFYVAAEGSVQNARESCEVRVDVAYPQGWTFALYSVDTRGYAFLADSHARAHIKTDYKFQHGGAVSVENRNLRGPMDEVYAYRAVSADNNLKWAPCNGQPRDNGLVLTTDITAQISANSGGALMTVDTQDGELRQKFGLAWKRCGRSSR